MRMRNKPWAKQELETNPHIIKEGYKGKWAEYFGNTNPIYIEIGCGKGRFIIENAIKLSKINRFDNLTII